MLVSEWLTLLEVVDVVAVRLVPIDCPSEDEEVRDVPWLLLPLGSLLEVVSLVMLAAV